MIEFGVILESFTFTLCSVAVPLFSTVTVYLRVSPNSTSPPFRSVATFEMLLSAVAAVGVVMFFSVVFVSLESVVAELNMLPASISAWVTV